MKELSSKLRTLSPSQIITVIVSVFCLAMAIVSAFQGAFVLSFIYSIASVAYSTMVRVDIIEDRLDALKPA